jgi:mRNA-degrading endonuclease toxin of MazEF toxin-antitoxin module
LLTSGDVIDVRLGEPEGHEAGRDHPAVVVTAQAVLDQGPSVVFVVPLTSTIRDYESEVAIEPDELNGLDAPSAVQVQHLRSASTGRLGAARGNVGAEVLTQVRDALADLLDLPV